MKQGLLLRHKKDAQGLAFSLLDYEIIISGGTLTPEIWEKGWEAARDEWLAEGPRDPNRLFDESFLDYPRAQ
jgi:hypothetical protein